MYFTVFIGQLNIIRSGRYPPDLRRENNARRALVRGDNVADVRVDFRTDLAFVIPVGKGDTVKVRYLLSFPFRGEKRDDIRSLSGTPKRGCGKTMRTPGSG